MDSSRLLALLNSLETDFAGGYDERLRSLIQAYAQVRDNPQQDNSAAIRAAVQSLDEFLVASPVNGFVPSWLHMMNAIGASGLFGLSASARIREAIDTSTLGPMTALKALEAFAEELRKFHQSASEIRSGLQTVGIEPDVLSGDTTEIGIILPTNVTKNELGVLTKQLEEWNRILRTVSELAGDKEREIIIRGIATGDLEFFVVATYLAGKMLGEIIGGVTSWYEKVLRIRVLSAELRKEVGPSPEVVAAEEREKALLEETVQRVVEKVLKLAPPMKSKERGEELGNHLSKCVRRIAVLIDNGVEIEVSVSVRGAERGVDADHPDQEGDARLPEQLEAARKNHLEKVAETLNLKAQGAAVARLPKREAPIFLLTDGEIPPEKGKEEAGTKKPPK